MTVHLDDKSTKSILMAMVAEINKAIDTDTVKPRLEARIAVRDELLALANGRYVTRLLDYME